MSTPIVAVVGASGGLGASTLALAVGRRLTAAGGAATVVDLDLTRGGLDVTAGVEHLTGRRWRSFVEVRGPVPPPMLLPALPTEGRCRLLSAGSPQAEVPPTAVADVLGSLLAADDPVVLDLPGHSTLLPLVLRHAPLVVLLTGLRTRALADCDALVDRLAAADEPDRLPDLRLVTRGPRPSAGVLDDVVAHLGVTHLHHLPDDPHVVRQAERGVWPGAGTDAVRRCADRVVEVALADTGRAEAS